MNDRTRRRVDTGFKSLRELLVAGIGAGTFWLQTTRMAHPDPFALGASILLMATPSLTSLYRIVNGLYGAWGRAMRDADERGDKEETP